MIVRVLYKNEKYNVKIWTEKIKSILSEKEPVCVNWKQKVNL